MSHEQEDDALWREAWELGRATMKGATRRRVAGSAPGVEISLLDWGGDGELVILHHANGFCGATLAPIASALSNRFRVVTIDARGQGDSTSVSPAEGPAAYAWTTLAADLHSVVAQILDFVGVDRIKLAIGHSFGGTLLLIDAQQEAAPYENILLCDPVILPSMSELEQVARSNDPGLAALSLKRRDRFPSLAGAYAHFRSRGFFANFTKEALALYVGEALRATTDGEVTLKCTREVEAAVFGNAGQNDLFSDVDKITANVLFLHAANGNFDRGRYDALAARMPSGRVESIEAGHLFPLEEPARVLAGVEELVGDV